MKLFLNDVYSNDRLVSHDGIERHVADTGDLLQMTDDAYRQAREAEATSYRLINNSGHTVAYCSWWN